MYIPVSTTGWLVKTPLNLRKCGWYALIKCWASCPGLILPKPGLHRNRIHPSWHTACPLQACCPTCPAEWGDFLQVELRCKHLPIRKGLISEPDLWMGVQPPCDFFFFNRMGLYFQRLNIAGSLTNIVFNKTTARYRQQPRLPFAI